MQGFRFLLFPFAIIYDGITRLRNAAFNAGILEQKQYDIPIIAVGNLSTGGTGKTPMIEYLVEKHKGKRIAVLSRGYGRKTKGYREVLITDNATNVGDEPLQFKNKYGNALIVAVCEKRARGIDALLKNHDLDLILLDDAYQHRYVKASTYMLLTSYDKPYYDDFLLPMGNLREARKGASRAQKIIVTKCPIEISDHEMNAIKKKINPKKDQQVYFTAISYETFMLNSFRQLELKSLARQKVTIVTGIAKPKPFVKYITSFCEVEHLQFKDHHVFSEDELRTISSKDLVITTEKDFMRLKDQKLDNVFYIPVKTLFVGNKKL